MEWEKVTYEELIRQDIHNWVKTTIGAGLLGSAIGFLIYWALR